MRKIARLCIACLLAGSLSGCVYSFTGVSIPSDVETIYIPSFPDRSGSGIGNLSDRLNEALVDRFVAQSRLNLTNNRQNADAILDGEIVSYSISPFVVDGQEQANLNQVQISVQASFKYREEDEPVWDKRFSDSFEFETGANPADAEVEAAMETLQRISDNMFTDALSRW